MPGFQFARIFQRKRGASHLDEINFIEHALRQAAVACGATVLAVHLHADGENAGVTGVVMLGQSQISIHTWPEIDYMALDVCMGGSDPHRATPVLYEYFKPREMIVTESARGRAMSAELI